MTSPSEPVAILVHVLGATATTSAWSSPEGPLCPGLLTGCAWSLGPLCAERGQNLGHGQVGSLPGPGQRRSWLAARSLQPRRTSGGHGGRSARSRGHNPMANAAGGHGHALPLRITTSQRSVSRTSCRWHCLAGPPSNRVTRGGLGGMPRQRGPGHWKSDRLLPPPTRCVRGALNPSGRRTALHSIRSGRSTPNASERESHFEWSWAVDHAT